MTKKLPKGWVEATLGEVTVPVPALRPKSTPEVEYTCFDIGGIDNQHARIPALDEFAGVLEEPRNRWTTADAGDRNSPTLPRQGPEWRYTQRGE